MCFNHFSELCQLYCRADWQCMSARCRTQRGIWSEKREGAPTVPSGARGRGNSTHRPSLHVSSAFKSFAGIERDKLEIIEGKRNASTAASR